MELFAQTFWITVVGMGLTFAAIGLLVVTMIVLTRWTRDRDELVRDASPPTSIPACDIGEDARQAAAAALAVALALEARSAAHVGARHASRAGEDISLWRAEVRVG